MPEPRGKKTVVVGPFPPPIQGAATINASLSVCLAAHGIDHLCIDISPGVLQRSCSYHVERCIKVLCGLHNLLRFRDSKRGLFDSCLISVDGGLGLLYNILFAAAARLLGLRIFLYHHSTSYIARRAVLASVLFRVAGKRVVHVLCSPVMADDLGRRYSIKSECMVINNAAWISGLHYCDRPPVCSRVSLGFLSNVSEDKGISRAIETLRELLRRDVDAQLLVAGGLSDMRAKEIVHAAKIEFKDRFQFIGVIGAKERRVLLESLNYFLFPSTYAHETQSLVVPEALAVGVPVIAVDHRYVGEVVGRGGHLVAVNDIYSLEAAKWILDGVGNTALELSRRANARDQFRELSVLSKKDISNLLSALSQS